MFTKNAQSGCMRRRILALAAVVVLGWSAGMSFGWAAAPGVAAESAAGTNVERLMNRAAALFAQQDYSEARKLCAEAETLNDLGHYTPALIQLAQAECLYRSGKPKDALKYYSNSLGKLSKADSAVVAKLALEGLGACCWQQADYAGAAKEYTELCLLNRDIFGDEDLDYGWSLLLLSEAYKQLGDERAKPLYEKAIWIFRKVNQDRLVAENKELILKHPEIEGRIARFVYGRGDKREYARADETIAGKSTYAALTNSDTAPPQCAWRANFRQTEAPGWVWMDPRVEQNAILICVHGLGLHHKSFESFARRIAPEGITTVSFDVRGFGSYINARGRDTIDMDACVEDLRHVVNAIRRDNPDVALYVLGESMGGAIVLRLAALSPEIMDGLICSVPAGSRHKSANAALAVGVHYLKDKHKPFDIGKQVVAQATAEEDLRQSWSQDPHARLKLSPKELMQFQAFMDQNEDVAGKITRTPVLIFQGTDDRLVKVEGTYNLFEAIRSPDRTLVLLGNTEHLIFEAGQFKDDVTLGVLGWMKAHCPKNRAAQSASTR